MDKALARESADKVAALERLTVFTTSISAEQAAEGVALSHLVGGLSAADILNMSDAELAALGRRLDDERAMHAARLQAMLNARGKNRREGISGEGLLTEAECLSMSGGVSVEVFAEASGMSAEEILNQSNWDDLNLRLASNAAGARARLDLLLSQRRSGAAKDEEFHVDRNVALGVASEVARTLGSNVDPSSLIDSSEEEIARQRSAILDQSAGRSRALNDLIAAKRDAKRSQRNAQLAQISDVRDQIDEKELEGKVQYLAAGMRNGTSAADLLAKNLDDLEKMKKSLSAKHEAESARLAQFLEAKRNGGAMSPDDMGEIAKSLRVDKIGDDTSSILNQLMDVQHSEMKVLGALIAERHAGVLAEEGNAAAKELELIADGVASDLPFISSTELVIASVEDVDILEDKLEDMNAQAVQALAEIKELHEQMKAEQGDGSEESMQRIHSINGVIESSRIETRMDEKAAIASAALGEDVSRILNASEQELENMREKMRKEMATRKEKLNQLRAAKKKDLEKRVEAVNAASAASELVNATWRKQLEEATIAFRKEQQKQQKSMAEQAQDLLSATEGEQADMLASLKAQQEQKRDELRRQIEERRRKRSEIRANASIESAKVDELKDRGLM